jgi:hypothetical protein
MSLEELLIGNINSLGSIRWSNSFGWICVYTGKNLFGGYKVIDNDILLLWLILSPSGFQQALQSGFEKFNFGKTWVQTEVIGKEDWERIKPFVMEAFNYTEKRRKNK